MFFQRIRLWGGWASLVAGIAFVVPTAPANAALHGQPTAITITPEFADTVRSGIAARALSEEGVVKVAQAGPAVRRRRLRQRRVRNQRLRNANRRLTNQQRRVNRRVVDRRAARNPRVVNRRLARRNRNLRQRLRTQRRINRQLHRDRIYRNGRWYRYRDGYYYDDAGVALVVGALGLTAGAIIGSGLTNDRTVVIDRGGYLPQPYTAEWYRRCDLKYRSFRASDGTYLGYDGIRHTCRLP